MTALESLQGVAGLDEAVAIELRPALFAARARSRALVVPVPVDYLHLTEVAAEFVATPDPKGARREIRLSGVASAKAPRGADGGEDRPARAELGRAGEVTRAAPAERASDAVAR